MNGLIICFKMGSVPEEATTNGTASTPQEAPVTSNSYPSPQAAPARNRSVLTMRTCHVWLLGISPGCSRYVRHNHEVVRESIINQVADKVSCQQTQHFKLQDKY